MKFNNAAVKASIIALGMMPATVNAFWRMECRSRSGFGRLDPLISPGEIAAHAHTIFGSSGFGPDATYSSLLAGDCTSCSVAEDKSAYWTPALYFQGADGSFTLVPEVGGMLAYYFLNSNPGEKITAFPKGFRMIAGDTFQRNMTDVNGQETQFNLAQKAIGFNCLNYGAAPEGTLARHFLPEKSFLDANCADGIRMEVMFPSCWNGKDLDSPNHKDHAAYPSTVMDGQCPEGFETRLPGLMYETIWDTTAFKSQSGQFVIANGDPTGYGYHGDFMMGWEEDVLEKAVDTCTNLSGMIQDCPVFTIQDSSVYSACNFSTPIVQKIANLFMAEDVIGPMPTLPGNVAIQSGPARANGGAVKATSAALDHTGEPVPSATYVPGTTASVSGSFVAGAVFLKSSATAEASTSTSSSVSIAAPVAPPATTEAPVLSSSSVKGAYTTIYSTSGNEVIEMVMYEETTTVEDVVTTIVFDKRHLHGHRHVRRGN